MQDGTIHEQEDGVNCAKFCKTQMENQQNPSDKNISDAGWFLATFMDIDLAMTMEQKIIYFIQSFIVFIHLRVVRFYIGTNCIERS